MFYIHTNGADICYGFHCFARHKLVDRYRNNNTGIGIWGLGSIWYEYSSHMIYLAVCDASQQKHCYERKFFTHNGFLLFIMRTSCFTLLFANHPAPPKSF